MAIDVLDKPPRPHSGVMPALPVHPSGRRREVRAAVCGACGGNDGRNERCSIRRSELAHFRRIFRALSALRQRKGAEVGA